MKTSEETRAWVAEFMGNVRECMKDHNVSIAELATLTGMTQHKLRLQLINGNLDVGVCGVLYRRTGDHRAHGAPKDWVSTRPLDPETIRLAQTYLAESH
ncbi:hypothetical protein [Brevibacterium zhoupengii]|uniref:hypothetical protein n=1 Tax=Brevibacterium zhoupengii TaxID=2898795 RepID=UPI001E64B168|nr:hypothetical protein [Brevibacterium zhoupengii]